MFYEVAAPEDTDRLEGISGIYAFRFRVGSSEHVYVVFCCLLSLNGRFIAPFQPFSNDTTFFTYVSSSRIFIGTDAEIGFRRRASLKEFVHE